MLTTNVFPVLATKDEAKRRGDLARAAGRGGIAGFDFGPTFTIALVVEDGETLVWVDMLMLEALGSTNALALACENLRARTTTPLRRTVLSTGRDAWVVGEDDGLGSGRLLLHDLWEPLQAELPGELLVRVPVRGVVICCSNVAADMAFVDSAAKLFEEKAAAAAGPNAAPLVQLPWLVWTPQGWGEVELLGAFRTGRPLLERRRAPPPGGAPANATHTSPRRADRSVPRGAMGLNIAKVVDELGDGTFRVRTNGLSAHNHAEMWIAGIAFEAVEPAAKIIDYVIQSVVEKGKQLKPGENVGMPLSIAGDDDAQPLFLGVHAVEQEPAVRGFFAKLRGSATFGVLRLIDLPGVDPGPPVEAVAAMMLFRANCRLAGGDAEGAARELRDSVRMFPGDPEAGPPPDFEPAEGAACNWQNHLGYLRLAELSGEQERAATYRELYARFDWLAQRDLGGDPAALAGVSESTLFEDAKQILAENLASSEVADGPTEGMRFVPSPLWVAGENDTVLRELSMLPAGFVAYSFGEKLALPEASEALARDAAACVARHLDAPWALSALTSSARSIYGSSPMRRAVPGVTYRPWTFLLSAVLAEGARYLHAGATREELHQAFALAPHDRALAASLAEKVETLEAWEGRQYMAAMGAP